MFKRTFAVLLIILLLCCSSGCNKQTKTFTVEDYGLKINLTVPDDWSKVEHKTYDLQLQNKSETMNLSVFLYNKNDLAEDMDADGLFETQRDLLLDLRKNATKINGTQYTDYDDKTVISERYTAELEGNKFCYDMYLLKFDDGKSLVWVMFNGVPSYIELQDQLIKQIISGITAR